MDEVVAPAAEPAARTGDGARVRPAAMGEGMTA